MPLPPALLKRLAKRGLVDKNVKQKSAAAAQQPTEEIIAEDYDDVDEPRPFEYDYEYQSKKNRNRQPQNFWSERLKKRIVDGSINGYKGCPNKYNIYHRCSLYCVTTFGDGIKEPSKSYEKRKIRLLRRYPLPKDWEEVYDEGIGIHYYWNTIDDTVSWLPPSHSKASVTKSAAQLRKELEASQPDQDENDDESIQQQQQQQQQPMEGIESSGGYSSDSNQAIVREPMQQQQPKQTIKKPKARDLDKVIRTRSERRSKRDAKEGALDPMDPAAYSDVPRGKWSAGLESENTKTAADSTVSGTYQMRPYPNPGAVLRANAQKGQDDSDGQNSDHDDN